MKKSRSGKRQYAALGVRSNGEDEIEVLLITSRGTGRWVAPKGWPMRGHTAVEAAMIEAYEEAGAVGHALMEDSIGSYRYRKILRSGLEANIRVDVFIVLVDELLENWPEKGQRVVEWFSPSEAAASVAEPKLAKLIRRLPRMLVGIDWRVTRT